MTQNKSLKSAIKRLNYFNYIVFHEGIFLELIELTAIISFAIVTILAIIALVNLGFYQQLINILYILSNNLDASHMGFLMFLVFGIYLASSIAAYLYMKLSKNKE